jgi:hypothetical protein
MGILVDLNMPALLISIPCPIPPMPIPLMSIVAVYVGKWMGLG